MTANHRYEEIEKKLAEASGVISSLESLLPTLYQAADLVAERLRSRGCLLVFGNGGSAAQAQHIAAELVGRFESERRPLPSVALTTDSSVLTSLANDYSFEEIFARQVRALGRPGDVVLALSTSGDSPNVLRGLDAARESGLRTIGFTARQGGKMRARVDLCLCVPSSSTPRIQEAHLVLAHLFCGLVEAGVLAGSPAERG